MKKRKAVIRTEQSQLDRVRRLVDAGQCRTVSDFVREALEEKLARIEHAKIAEAVDCYCAAGHADEDTDLIEAQAFDRKPSARRRREQ